MGHGPAFQHQPLFTCLTMQILGTLAQRIKLCVFLLIAPCILESHLNLLSFPCLPTRDPQFHFFVVQEVLF